LILLLIHEFQADVEFGKLQARDMLQHLWTGPISNSSVEVVQGSRSVEVRAVGVTKVISSLVSKIFLHLAVISSTNIFYSSNIVQRQSGHIFRERKYLYQRAPNS
jgi:hypothetical protein